MSTTNNLLDIPVIGPLLRSPWPWRLLRFGMLVLLLAMAAYGWHQHAIPGVPARDPLMYTNFANYFFWVLWMMGVVFVAALFGRAWCTVCPLGWLNGLVSRCGLRRELPGWLRGFLPVTLVLVALQLAVYLLALHRFPDYTAILLVWMILLAVLLGLVFQRRSFCLLLCPAGTVFGLYARLAPLELRVKDAAVCSGCAAKPCIATAPLVKRAALGSQAVQWRARPEGCPVALVPAEIRDNAACTLCLNCVRSCCNDNIRISARRFGADLARHGLGAGESLFFLVLLGLLTANFAKVHVTLREAIFWLPERIAQLLGWGAGGFYPLAVLWVALLFPLLLLLPGTITWLVAQVKVTEGGESGAPGERLRLGPVLGRQAMVLLPLVMTAHVVLALVKFNAKLGYLPLVLQDPSGVKSYLALSVMRTLPAPGVLISLDLLKWLLVAVLAIGMGVSLRACVKIAVTSDGRRDLGLLAGGIVSVLVLSAFYGAVVFEWLFVR
ncbi:MAG: 4Fe-4S binding protein [Desulfuromonas sp.]|nr:4Fe-4S binding protein [Desulfuromonas sp.]